MSVGMVAANNIDRASYRLARMAEVRGSFQNSMAPRIDPM